ncbi:MAG: heparinase II/III family protein [Cohaesibacter sp.]|nr:heparinase II/III family protein [Cohaesibacter sp.]
MASGFRKLKMQLAALSRRFAKARIRIPNCQARYVTGCPERLLIAPQDLRTTDPTLADDIYAGLFVFAGQVENCDGHSPFIHLSRSQDWTRELHGFRWLRHLRASRTNLAKSNAQILVDDWIQKSRNHPTQAWELSVTANRVMAWLNNSPLILQNADHDFYRQFIRALYVQIRYLRAAFASSPKNETRLFILMAELAGWLAFSGKERQAKITAKRLVSELEEQILPDGGHQSRNSMILIHCLLELLPLRQAFLARDMVPPDGLLDAIERMMPMLRFFRHSNGDMAHFNGAGATPADLLATILAYDETRGAPVSNASFSGYHRLEAGPMLALFDYGEQPPLDQSVQAHAGTLAFELSIDHAPLIVNCGAPSSRHENWRELARSTAAHSTLIIQDTNSCQFAGKIADLNGRPILKGPGPIQCERSLEHGQETIIAHHDAYSEKFGMRHSRKLWLAIDGRRLDGQDELLPKGKGIKAGQDAYAIRFHLHPSVHVELNAEQDRAYFALSNGEIWHFVCQDNHISLEDSVFLSDIHGIRPTKQLVLNGHASHISSIHWYFERVSFAQPSNK